MESKHLTDEQIAICAENLTDDSYNELTPEIREHIKTCDICAHEILMLSEIIKDIDDVVDVEPTLRKRIGNKQWFSIAAFIAVILSSSYFIYTIIDRPNKITDTITGNSKYNITEKNIESNNTKVIEDTIDQNPKADNIISSDLKSFQSTSQQNSMLSAFIPNKDLEKLTNRYLTGSLRGNEVKIITPNNFCTKSGEIKLDWINNSKQVLIIEFFNNKGLKLFEAETVESEFITNRISNHGLYYWKLLNDDFDLLFCGKIKVN